MIPDVSPPLTRSAAVLDESPLVIGSREMPSRYFLAPLAGYTHLAFRCVLRELGGLGLATTDLVQATMLLSSRRKSLELIETSPEDRPLSVQIFSGLKAELVRAARWLEDHGYGGVDLNMGCPMAKVNGSGGGARLMCDVDGACNIAEAAVSAVSIPVTVKMRLGWDATQLTAPALARAFEQVGIAAVTLHGRTRQQGFHGSVDLDGIRRTVEAVERIPIIGNGDVRTVDEAFQMRQVTGCAAVAIGRGAMLDPWIFSRIDRTVRGLPDAEPSPQEQVDFLVRHFLKMTEQHGDDSRLLFRKFAAWYGARLGIPEDLENRLRQLESTDDLLTIAEEIRIRHGTRRDGRPTALIRVPNGPVDKW